MRILFITERLPYPLDTGGKIRTYHILKGLSERHEVTLLTSCSQDQEQYLSVFENICAEVAAYKCTNNKMSKLYKAMLSLFCGAPFTISKVYNKYIFRHIKNAFKSNKNIYDAVHFDHLDSTVYKDYIPKNIYCILDEHNIVSDQIKSMCEAEQNIFKKAFLWNETRKVLVYEKKAVQEMDLCLTCSKHDQQILAGYVQDNKLEIVSNGVDIEYFDHAKWPKKDPGKSVVSFMGPLDYYPNLQAVRFFVENIFNHLKTDIKNIEFWIIGQYSPNSLPRYFNDSSISLLGSVEDIRPYLAETDVFVVPILSGSGTRLKILTAMAMGIPVVSTLKGAEGLEVEDDREIVLKDGPEEFAQTVYELIKNKAKRDRLISPALELVRHRYAWANIYKELNSAYMQHLSDKAYPSGRSAPVRSKPHDSISPSDSP